MPVTLEANYCKKVGLPGYSSHQFSLTVKVEIADLNQVQQQSTSLYAQLQDCVDRDIQATGYLPSADTANHGQPVSRTRENGHPGTNGRTVGPRNGTPDWNCTDKQRDLILSIVAEHQLPKDEIELLAQERFGKGVKALNKLEASGLIEELFEKHPAQREPGRTPQRRTYQRARA